MIKLTNRQILHITPGLSPVVCDGKTAVIAIHHEVGICGADPPGVMIGVDVASDKCGKRLPTVDALVDFFKQGIHDVFIFRITENMREIKRPVTDVFGSRQLPGFASVIRTVKSILFRFDDGIHPLRVAGRNGQSDTTQHSFGQTVFCRQLLKGLASVVGHIQSGSRATGFKKPGPTLRLPQGYKKFVGVARVHHHVGNTR